MFRCNMPLKILLVLFPVSGQWRKLVWVTKHCLLPVNRKDYCRQARYVCTNHTLLMHLFKLLHECFIHDAKSVVSKSSGFIWTTQVGPVTGTHEISQHATVLLIRSWKWVHIFSEGICWLPLMSNSLPEDNIQQNK